MSWKICRAQAPKEEERTRFDLVLLGIGAIEKRPKVVTGADGEDTIAIRTCAFFSISFDHRVIDGAVADEFLAFVKKTIEEFPESAV